MSGNILVTFEAISAASQDVLATTRNLNQRLDELRGYLAPLVADWTGLASEEYQAKQAQWNSSQADLTAVLRQIGQVLEAAHGDYRGAEQSNRALWS